MASSGGGDNWAWLGLLKWSLNYVDGTSDSPVEPMSEEKRKFLEQVMNDGIVDPSKRLQELLAQLTIDLKDTSKEDSIIEALEEVRDICEQIDFARYFVNMNGLLFLLGCIAQIEVAKSIRLECLKVLSTLAQNNPPVQQKLLESKGLDSLVGLYMTQSNENDPQGSFRTLILQALSCTVRGHAVGEESFCQSRVCRHVIELSLNPESPLKVQRKGVFGLRALITSDLSSTQRVRDFSGCLNRCVELVEHQDVEVREASLGLLLQVLQQRNSVDGVMSHAEQLAVVGVQRIQEVRQMKDDDKELHEHELDLWETLLVEFAKKPTDAVVVESPPLLLTGRPTDDPGTDLPQ